MVPIIEKIRSIRKNKGYSHENMANALGITQAAYSKIEKCETKLSVDRLFEISKILETSINDILDASPNNTSHQVNNGKADGNKDVQHLYQENKEKAQKIETLYEARLKDKEEVIAVLQRMVEGKK